MCLSPVPVVWLLGNAIVHRPLNGGKVTTCPSDLGIRISEIKTRRLRRDQILNARRLVRKSEVMIARDTTACTTPTMPSMTYARALLKV
jgi:hypothetical protein